MTVIIRPIYYCWHFYRLDNVAYHETIANSELCRDYYYEGKITLTSAGGSRKVHRWMAGIRSLRRIID